MNTAKTPISSADAGLNQFKMKRSHVRVEKNLKQTPLEFKNFGDLHPCYTEDYTTNP
jgi:hypothetical protein